MRRLILLVIVESAIWLTSLVAQDLQARLIFHPTIQLKEGWYLTGWSITNLRQHSSSNTNLFAGLGYQGKTWWLEKMLQRQWSKAGDQLLLNFRFQKKFGSRATLYVEPAVFLTKSALYDFVVFEYRTWHNLNLGAETENVHRSGSDSWGAGPRLAYPVGIGKNFKLVGAVSYQIRKQEKDALRLYLVLNRRF